MTDHKRIDDVTGTATSGHEWDGIEELDTPMPRWWLWSLYASIVWAIGYVILYPAWTMVNSATEGVLGWTSRGQLEAEMRADAQRRQPVVTSNPATAINDLPGHPALMHTAVQEIVRANIRTTANNTHLVSQLMLVIIKSIYINRD